MTQRTRTLLALASGLTAGCASQRPEYGVEVQAYPAGVIPGLHVQLPQDELSAITLRAAHNFSDREDYGEFDDEEGGGFGGGVGYRRYLEPGREGWLWGGRVDVWALEIDWEDQGGTPMATSGTTDIVVLQPTVEGGYGFRLSEGLRLEATLGLGAEINVDTDGEDVGEGAILLLGLTLLAGG